MRGCSSLRLAFAKVSFSFISRVMIAEMMATASILIKPGFG
jgi:hypothetical protein